MAAERESSAALGGPSRVPAAAPGVWRKAEKFQGFAGGGVVLLPLLVTEMLGINIRST